MSKFRAAALLLVLAQLPGPLSLIEVGASAGLCLYPDRFTYRSYCWCTPRHGNDSRAVVCSRLRTE